MNFTSVLMHVCSPSLHSVISKSRMFVLSSVIQVINEKTNNAELKADLSELVLDSPFNFK